HHRGNGGGDPRRHTHQPPAARLRLVATCAGSRAAGYALSARRGRHVLLIMPTWILLLRGINVGGNSRLLMKDLKRILASFDLENVRTYIQSGNVTFQTSEAVSATLAEEIAARIEEHSGFRPHLFLLPADQFERAVAANPFPQA